MTHPPIGESTTQLLLHASDYELPLPASKRDTDILLIAPSTSRFTVATMRFHTHTESFIESLTYLTNFATTGTLPNVSDPDEALDTYETHMSRLRIANYILTDIAGSCSEPVAVPDHIATFTTTLHTAAVAAVERLAAAGVLAENPNVFHSGVNRARVSGKESDATQQIIDVLLNSTTAVLSAMWVNPGPLTDTEHATLNALYSHPVTNPNHVAPAGARVRYNRTISLCLHAGSLPQPYRPELVRHLIDHLNPEGATAAEIIGDIASTRTQLDDLIATNSPHVASRLLRSPHLNTHQVAECITIINTDPRIQQSVHDGNPDRTRSLINEISGSRTLSDSLSGDAAHILWTTPGPLRDTLIADPNLTHKMQSHIRGGTLLPQTVHAIVTDLITTGTQDHDNIAHIVTLAITKYPREEAKPIAEEFLASGISVDNQRTGANDPLYRAVMHNGAPREWHLIALRTMPKKYSEAYQIIDIVKTSTQFTVEDLQPYANPKGTKFERAVNDKIGQLTNTPTTPDPAGPRKPQPTFASYESLKATILGQTPLTIAHILTITQEALLNHGNPRSVRGEAGNIILDILNTDTTHTAHINDNTWKALTNITSITQTPSPELLMWANTATSKAANRFAAHTIRASLNI